VAAGVALVALAVVPASANAGAYGSTAAANAAVEDDLDALVGAENGPPGASALIQRGNKIDFLRSGVADLRTDRAIHRRDHMRIASTAKAYSGAVALSLVDQGLLSLDDTLGELLPEATPEAWSAVTLADLMRHTSGVPTFTSDPEFRIALGANPRRYWVPQQLIDFVADEPLGFAPGSKYEYSNTDNILVGMIAEATTGHVYQTDLRQLVYRPLGLRDTSLPRNWVMPRRFIHGYAFEEGFPPEDVSEAISASGVWASGGIVSTPADMNQFVRGYVSGELFGGQARKRQFRFIPGCGEPPVPGECSVGLSVYRYETGCGTVFGHTGNFPGYTQFVASTKNGRRSLVLSANTQMEAQLDPELFAYFAEASEAVICATFAGRN
jgi:D-alanyl-D-alanine carboxypeptidase